MSAWPLIRGNTNILPSCYGSQRQPPALRAILLKSRLYRTLYSGEEKRKQSKMEGKGC